MEFDELCNQAIGNAIELNTELLAPQTLPQDGKLSSKPPTGWRPAGG